MMSLDTLQTPALVLDRDRLTNNIDVMQNRATQLGVILRPHLKTAKSVDVAACFGQHTSLPVTVSTLAEAEYFASAGYFDITYAVSINPRLMSRVARLYQKGTPVCVILDDADAARQVSEAAASHGIQLRVMIEIDTDGHRAGMEPDDPQLTAIAAQLSNSANIEFRGVITHAGGSYECHTIAQLEAHAEMERAGCVAAAQRIRDAGIEVKVVSVGSTPTALCAKHLDGVTELRAGVFVFQDLFQAGLGVCKINDIALSVQTTVIGHKSSHHRLIVDAGGLAMSKDRSTASQTLDCGYGLLADPISGRVIEGVKISNANQEHGVIDLPESIPLSQFEIGSQWRVYPNHACMTAAAYNEYHVVDQQGQLIERWTRINGW